MREPFRPRLHFTPRRNWMNDPNGLCWFDGEYHLFYQYNPHGDLWGHMSWGHAVSTDLVNWTELPLAIPEAEGEMAFSGSMVLDPENRTGLGAAMIAVYTGHYSGPPRREVQCLALSRDRGRTFVRYEGNPVLDLGLAEFRDPKVFWHAPTGRYVMVTVISDKNHAALFASSDLRRWDHLSDFGPFGLAGEVWECPDLSPIEGPDGEAFWLFKVDIFRGGVLGGSTGMAIIGRFDGVTFTPLPGETWRVLDHGADYYAAASFSGDPPLARGAPLMLGWMANHAHGAQAPTRPWRGAMSLARRLSLAKGDTGIVLRQSPVIDAAFGPLQPLGRLEGEKTLPLDAEALLLAVELCGTGATALALDWSEGDQVVFGYDPARGGVYVDRANSGAMTEIPDFAAVRVAPWRPAPGARLLIGLVIDACSVELFCEEEGLCITSLVFPSGTLSGLRRLSGADEVRVAAAKAL